MSPQADVAVLVAEPTTSPQSEVTRETIDRLRSDVLPEALDGSPARAHVGGQIAVFADLGHRVQDRLPWFIAAVVVLSFFLLMLLFRSLLVPLKAVAMNLLSVGAAYGVLVMVFQWGWGGELIGVESTVPILSFIPLFMFAILFGLSMDYEVFLLSRVREEYVRTGDNDEAVMRGLAGTARTITSAALIMVAVFGGFVLGADPLVKMMGLGLATAIALDATVVRLVLVPATMKLLGEANWWLPGWLDRLLPGSPDPTRPGEPQPSIVPSPLTYVGAKTPGPAGVDGVEDSLLDGAGPGDAHLVDVEPGLDLAQHDVVDPLLVAQLEERRATSGDEGEQEARVLVVVLDDRVVARTGGGDQRALHLQLVPDPGDDRLAAAKLGGRGVDGLEGRVEGGHLGELEPPRRPTCRRAAGRTSLRPAATLPAAGSARSPRRRSAR